MRYSGQTIIRGTTPLITFDFTDSGYSASDITDAKLSILLNDNAVVQLPFSSATVDAAENTISWTVDQANSLKLKAQTLVQICCDWVIGTTRGRSELFDAWVEPTGVNEVM